MLGHSNTFNIYIEEGRFPKKDLKILENSLFVIINT